MKNIINELLSINYTDVNQEANYKELAYEILDTLTKNELLEIVKIEDIYVRNNSDKNDIKSEVYYSLVGFRLDRKVLGEVAAHSYRDGI